MVSAETHNWKSRENKCQQRAQSQTGHLYHHSLHPRLRDNHEKGGGKTVRDRCFGRIEQNSVFWIWQDSSTHKYARSSQLTLKHGVDGRSAPIPNSQTLEIDGF